MHELLPLVGIAGSIAVGAMSPGPSFLMVARTAVASSRSAGLAAALGMGLGGVSFAIAALAGLQAVFAAVPSLFLALKILGGLYLIYLGYRIWRGAQVPLSVTDPAGTTESDARRSFLLAAGTQLSNPKAAIIYASVFAAFLPPNFTVSLAISTVLVIFLIEAGWYTLVALVLSSSQPRAAYLRFKAWIDRSAGAVMSLLGVKLILSART
ncbi:threonine transporter [Geomonas limicola]|uniref:Threonine transporter n=1 Tax=Geomonas limicola TaxID=2740186 RepID=A0A6V8NA61_9BACT|nr:LysE family transporter [Geomonas limicola]GFO68139.1 threonine transporter [Geomonas limicola]